MPEQTVAQFEHDDVRLAGAISVSMVRVSAGPHFAVVVTIPRSVKIMVRRAPESSNARMSRRRDTPVALKASTIESAMAHARDDGGGRGGLARLHAGAGERHHRHAAHVRARHRSPSAL